MATSALSHCKLLLFRRCLRAVLLSAAVQFLLLTVFLLFVNFQLVHPLQWVADTFSLVCSFYTWSASIPLICAVVVYGMALSQQHLAERRYCPTRYRWLLHSGPRKLLFLGAHLLVGYLTAWLYAGYLHSDYRHLVYRYYGQNCLSSYHVFLLGIGIAAGCYYFVSVHMRDEVSIDWPIVELSRKDRLLEMLYDTLLKAPINSLMPTLSYSVAFWLFGPLLKHRLSLLLGVDTDDRLVGIFHLVSNVRLLFYAWLMTTQILSNMHLMRSFYSMLLSEDLPLVVARSRVPPANDEDVTVVAGLSLYNVYLVQCLSAQFLYKEAQRNVSAVRLEIFKLTEPGNRPVNWRVLCDQCLSIIISFTEELTDSMPKISSINGTEQTFSVAPSDISSAVLAEKVLLRQYNQQHGIRHAIVTSLLEESAKQWNEKPVDNIRHVPSWCERISTQLEASLHQFLQRIPGIEYLFAESQGSKTLFLMDNSLPVAWLTQALAQICVVSLREDRYGVVQDDLSAIIKALHRLKCQLDKLSHTLTNSRTTQSNSNLLRCAVRRSLYNICNSFYDYLGELITPGPELHQLQAFINQG